jgi:hypothetical protein
MHGALPRPVRGCEAEGFVGDRLAGLEVLLLRGRGVGRDRRRRCNLGGGSLGDRCHSLWRDRGGLRCRRHGHRGLGPWGQGRAGLERGDRRRRGVRDRRRQRGRESGGQRRWHRGVERGWDGSRGLLRGRDTRRLRLRNRSDPGRQGGSRLRDRGRRAGGNSEGQRGSHRQLRTVRWPKRRWQLRGRPRAGGRRSRWSDGSPRGRRKRRRHRSRRAGRGLRC